MTINLSIPANAKLLVKSGQEVDFKTPFIKRSLKKSIKIKIADELGIQPAKIFLHLTKVVGDSINKGELLASKKTFWGEKKYFSDFEGLVKEVNHEDGSIIVDIESEEERTKKSYFKGEIGEIRKGEFELKVKKAKDFSLKEASNDFGGEVTHVAQDSLANLDPDKIENKIIVGSDLRSFDQTRLEVMGATGFVALQLLAPKISVPYARIKNPADWDEIKKIELPYCVIDNKNNIIYFYQ